MNSDDIVAEEMLMKAKEHEKELTKYRCIKRINKIIHTINNELEGFNTYTFTVSTSDRNQMISDVLTSITGWTGGRNYRKCKSWEECHIKVVRAWWNRVKCWKLGDYVFGPLIKLCFQFIIYNNVYGINQTKKVKTFINILLVLFNTKIRYPKSMARPIIPIQIFVKQNIFTDFCVKFVADFGVKWKTNGINNKYISNPKRSQQLVESYLDCLKSITFKINRYLKTSIETDPSFFSDNRNNHINDGFIPDPSNNPNIPPFPNLSEIIFNHQTPQLSQLQTTQNITNFSVSNMSTHQNQYQINNYYNPCPQQYGKYRQYSKHESQNCEYHQQPPNNLHNHNIPNNGCFECSLSYSQSFFHNNVERNNDNNQCFECKNNNININNNQCYANNVNCFDQRNNFL